MYGGVRRFFFAGPSCGRPWCSYRPPFDYGVRGAAPRKNVSPSQSIDMGFWAPFLNSAAVRCAIRTPPGVESSKDTNVHIAGSTSPVQPVVHAAPQRPKGGTSPAAVGRSKATCKAMYVHLHMYIL
jgi:hypothetical protein